MVLLCLLLQLIFTQLHTFNSFRFLILIIYFYNVSSGVFYLFLDFFHIFIHSSLSVLLLNYFLLLLSSLTTLLLFHPLLLSDSVSFFFPTSYSWLFYSLLQLFQYFELMILVYVF